MINWGFIVGVMVGSFVGTILARAYLDYRQNKKNNKVNKYENS